MKSILFGISMLTIQLSFGQVFQYEGDSKQVKTVLSHKLSVVTTGNEGVDAVVKKAFEENWKVGEFEFISPADMQKQISDESKTFCVNLNVEVTQGSFVKTKSYYGIINGGKKKFTNYSDNDIVVLCPRSLYTDENLDVYPEGYTYMIKGMNDALELAKSGKETGRFQKSLEPINKKFPAIAKNKTLIINKDMKQDTGRKKDTDPIVSEEAMKNYPHKYKFVSREEFEEYMKGDDDSVILMYPVIEVNKHILIFEPATKKIVYYGFGMSGLTVTGKDMKSAAAGES